MSVKQKIIEYVIRHDLVPKKVKWKKNVSAVGRLYGDVFRMLGFDDRQKLSKILYDWGVADAEEIIRVLKIKRDLHGCAIAILAANNLFGIKSAIIKEEENKVVIHSSHCMWKNRKGWNPELCASIEQYEVGLVKGISKNVSYFCARRRSEGDRCCEVILTSK